MSVSDGYGTEWPSACAPGYAVSPYAYTNRANHNPDKSIWSCCTKKLNSCVARIIHSKHDFCGLDDEKCNTKAGE